MLIDTETACTQNDSANMWVEYYESKRPDECNDDQSLLYGECRKDFCCGGDDENNYEADVYTKFSPSPIATNICVAVPEHKAKDNVILWEDQSDHQHSCSDNSSMKEDCIDNGNTWTECPKMEGVCRGSSPSCEGRNEEMCKNHIGCKWHKWARVYRTPQLDDSRMCKFQTCSSGQYVPRFMWNQIPADNSQCCFDHRKCNSNDKVPHGVIGYDSCPIEDEFLHVDIDGDFWCRDPDSAKLLIFSHYTTVLRKRRRQNGLRVALR